MVRSTELDPVTPPPVPAAALPLTPLDYAPPPPRGSGVRDTVWNIIISVFLANGVGWATFGLAMMARYRDDEAGPAAVGFGSITLGLSLAFFRYAPRLGRPRQR